MRKRPLVRPSRVMAVMAVIAGVRACICIIPAPSLMLDVRAPTKARKVITSEPQASPDHTESKPSRSASRMSSIVCCIRGPEYPVTKPSRIARPPVRPYYSAYALNTKDRGQDLRSLIGMSASKELKSLGRAEDITGAQPCPALRLTQGLLRVRWQDD